MTKAEKHAVLEAIAKWEPRVPSVELIAADRQELREQVAYAVAEALGLEPEQAEVGMSAIRMSS
jgi:phage baseplate assembly protein W